MSLILRLRISRSLRTVRMNARELSRLGVMMSTKKCLCNAATVVLFRVMVVVTVSISGQ